MLLDLLRGLAAFVVLIEHARNLFFVDFGQLSRHTTLFAVPYLLTAAGHQAVVVFFLLSGFFISGAIARARQRGRWSWRDYLLRRVIRLWVVLIPALLLCLLWDRLGIHLGHAPGLYSGTVPNHMVGDVRALLSWRSFFGNLFFQQEILTPPFGSDGALWSLAYEFWYYILFPLGLFALLRQVKLSHRLLYGGLFIAIAWFVRGAILTSFPIWLSGAVLIWLPHPRFTSRQGRHIRLTAGVVYATVFFSLARITYLSSITKDYLLTLVTFVLLWLLLSATSPADLPHSLSVRATRTLARFSYSLYALHTPLLVLVASLLLGDTRWIPSWWTCLQWVGIVLLSLAYAYGVAFLSEFRTDALRERIEPLFGIALRAPSPSDPIKHSGSNSVQAHL